MTEFKRLIVIICHSAAFTYLLQRYADRIGCSVTNISPSELEETICPSEPVAVIFSSVEILEMSQSLVAELTNCDIPIIACSSATDQVRTRELGADYCLLHPLTYDNFQMAFMQAAASKKCA